MKRIVVLALAIFLAGGLAADQLTMDVYINKPSAEIKQLHKTNLDKGKELYNLKKFKESLPYLDKAIFFSKVLIAQAELRKKALDSLKEARKWVNDAGNTVKKNSNQ